MDWYYILLIVLVVGVLCVLFIIAPGNYKKCMDSRWLYKTLIAHRGIFNNETNIVENSASAFKKAIEKKYSVETDLHLTLDEQIIIFHDNDFNRMCGVNKKVSELTLKEIKELSLKNSDEKIMELSEFLHLIDGKIDLLLEFKSQSRSKDIILCQNAMKLLKNYKGRYAVQSFQPLIVRWFKKNYPLIPRGQLFLIFNIKEELKKLSSKGKGYKLLAVILMILYNIKFTNLITRPIFITHEYKSINIMAKICHLFMPMIVYTVDNENDFNNIVNKVDNVIFERINLNNYERTTRKSNETI